MKRGSSEVLPEPSKRAPYVHYSDRRTGFWFSAELNVGALMCQFDDKSGTAVNLAMDITGGYRFSQYLKVGLGLMPGTPIWVSDDEPDDTFLLPVYFQLRGNFIDDEVRTFVPFWAALGFRYGQPRHALVMGLAYTARQFEYEPSAAAGTTAAASQLGWGHILSLKIGYEF